MKDTVEKKQPPRPGQRRRITFNCLNTEAHKAEFIARVDTLEKAGLIAEVSADFSGSSGIVLWATRRPSR